MPCVLFLLRIEIDLELRSVRLTVTCISFTMMT